MKILQQVGETFYPMNHAPLAACVPFWRQARKWCPPATLSQHVPQTGKYACLARYCSGVRPFPSPRSASCMLPRCSPRHSFEYPIDLQSTHTYATQRNNKKSLRRRRRIETREKRAVLLCVLAEAILGEHEGIRQPRKDHVERLAEEGGGELREYQSASLFKLSSSRAFRFVMHDDEYAKNVRRESGRH
jgi:hypothetical protein